MTAKGFGCVFVGAGAKERKGGWRKIYSKKENFTLWKGSTDEIEWENFGGGLFSSPPRGRGLSGMVADSFGSDSFPLFLFSPVLVVKFGFFVA